MRKYKLETQLFCLYYSPVIVVTFISFGLYILLFEQLKIIVSSQESGIYYEQQSNKKQLLMGLKAHLDQSFGLQSQEYYLLSRFVTKVYENKIKLSSSFKNTFLNLDSLYENKESQSLINLYQKNQILTSIWVNGDKRSFSDLSIESQDELNKGAVLDVLIRNFNLLNSQRTFQYKNQFMGFALDGALIANPAYNQSMTESFQTQSLCPQIKYYDARCRIWYQQAIKKQETKQIKGLLTNYRLQFIETNSRTFLGIKNINLSQQIIQIVSFMPAPYKVLTTKIPYMSISLCRRNNVYEKLNSVACQAFNIEQVASVFQQLEIQTGGFLVIHPLSDSLIYEKNIKDYQQTYNWTTVVTNKMTDVEKQFFLETVQNKMNASYQNDNIDYQQYVNQLNDILGFEYTEQSDLKYCLLVPIQIADVANGKKQTSYSSIMIMMYTFRKDEMISSYSTLFFYLGNAFIANSVFYLILLIICLLIIMFYAKKFSQLIELPIQNLIDKINSINQHLLDKNGLGSQDEIFVVFDNKYSKSRKYQHTCSELTNLERYITNIQEIFNFNFNYNQKIEETTALFTWIKAIKTFQQVEDYKALGSALNNIANIHFNNQRYTEALDCYSQSIVCLEQEKTELAEGQQLEKENSEINSETNNRKDSLFTPKKFSDVINSNNQLSSKRKKSSLIPWIEKYFCKYLDGKTQSSSKLQVLKQAQKNLESLKFDRLFAYSQVLLQCTIDDRMEHEIINQRKKQHKKREYYESILQDSEFDLDTAKTSTSLHSDSQSSFKSKNHKYQDEAIFFQYFQVLKKLLRIAKNLDNDYNRYILIYLEISKAYLLQSNVQLSQKYLDLAYRNFLELYKRIKATLFSVQNKSQAHFYSQYLQFLNQILIKRFSSEEVNEEINFNRSFSPSKIIGGKSPAVTQKINTSFNNIINSSPSPIQHKRKQSKGNPKTQLSVSSSPPLQNTPLNNIHPIMEDHMESQEEVNLQKGDQQYQEKSLQFDKSKRERQSSTPMELNTIYVHLAKKYSTANSQNTPTSSLNNINNLFQRRQSQQAGQNGSFHQFISSLQGYSPKTIIGTATTDQNLCTNQSLSYDNPINKMYLLNNPSESFIDGIKIEEETQPINQTKQQLDALDDAIEAFNNSSYTKTTSWYQKTSYSFPIDILFTKLQIQEAIIQLKNRNYQKGCTLLTEAFEFAPRYLGNDRMTILNILQYVCEKNSFDSRIIQKQALKFQKIILKISIIVNCEPSYLKRVSKQLYDIYQLSDTFSLVMVNEQVEQYIAPISQSNFRGKEIFINNIMKYLRFKHIQSNQQFFLSALIKSSHQFQNINRLQNQEIQKKYILIFGDRDCIFRDALYKHKIFKLLGNNKVKILIFNPQDDKEGAFMNLQCLELPFKVRFFFKFYQLIDYFKKKSIKCSFEQPFLIEKI